MSRPIQCVGMKVDAYILNSSVIADTYFLAPSNKPAYESLLPGRLNLRHDFVPPVDLKNAFPWQQNSRIADVESGELIKSRLGIYLHCSGAVEYESVPDRWLVFRHVGESQPSTVASPALEVFLVESNRIRKLNSVIASGEDLETSTSPFLDPEHPAEDQLRTVLGRVSRLTEDWYPGAGGLDDQAAASQEGYHCPFTVLETGNTIFADYMPHNAAVFTLHDDLAWSGQAPGTTESAKVSYAVYGFSSKDARELLSDPVAGELSSDQAFSTSTNDPKPVQVCWGSLQLVDYQRSEPPTLIKAAGKAQDFHEKTPLAIGEDVMDACIAMLGGSSDSQESSMSDILRRLRGAAALPESNSQLDRAATATTNFKSAHGGYRWRLAKDQSKHAEPGHPMAPTDQTGLITPEQIAALRRLNQVQTYLDGLFRRKRYVRHLIFCQWWKHRSLNAGWDWEWFIDWIWRGRRREAVRIAQRFLKRMETINSLIAGAERLLNTIEESERSYGPFVKEANAKFFSHVDPAFALQDMGSGWPGGWDIDASIVNDRDLDSWLCTYASSLKVWINKMPLTEYDAPSTEARIRLHDVWDQFLEHKGLHQLPKEMRISLKNLMAAFSRDLIANQPAENPLMMNPSWEESCWDGQPWLPVFVEWEAEYVHIPREMWQLSHSDDGTVSYGLRSDKKLADYSLSSRTFSGRSILLPNAQKLIIGLMKMIYSSIPGTGDLEKSDQNWTGNFLGNLSFLFGRLDGFTDHLLTLCQGAHVVPPLVAVQLGVADDHLIRSRVASYRAGEEILTDEAALRLFYGCLPGGSNDATESAGGLDVTPYGDDHEGLSYTASQGLDRPSEKDSFFRPVTHGQARLVQFKLVDRFGQVICAIDPRPNRPAKPFYPHIGEGILCEPQSGGSEPNTAKPLTPEEITRGDCPWFQLGPRINQDARLLASFMCDWQSSGGQYRPVAEGERAAFAWLLINYHNRSLQVYDGDCSFRGEAFLPSGPDEPIYWQTLLGRGQGQDILPHMLPEAYSPLLKQQLQQLNKERLSSSSPPGSQTVPMTLVDLIVSMSHAPFLIELWKTVVAAQDYMQPPPVQQYARFSSALVGRPLALARLGLGMELATAPMRSQAYADPAETAAEAGDDPSEGTGDEELLRYDFAAKIGDMLGRQDGLVAYFSAPKNPDTDDGAWTINTDYTARDMSSSLVQHTTNAPPLSVSPVYPRLLPPPATVKETLHIADEVADYERRAAKELYASITTVLIDPFLPVHVRSAVLPIAKAQLDRAVVEHDLRHLGVWLQAGPVLIGARGTDPVAEEEGKVRIQTVDQDVAPPPGPRVPVHTAAPAEGGAKWKWVQPVEDEKGSVNYLSLGVMPPLKEGFDCVAAIESEETKGQKVEMAVALDGYLLLESTSSS